MKGNFKKLVFVTLITAIFHAPIACANSNRFNGSEHMFIGNNVSIRFDSNDPGVKQAPLHLPNGLVLSFGEIVPLGDLYGIPEKPISLGKNVSDREARFILAFNTLAQNRDSVVEAQQLIASIHDEDKFVEEEMKKGKTAEEAFKDLGSETSRQYNCITGGGCSATNWWLTPGRYLDLARENYDHFNENAWIAYMTGHHLAVRLAAQAHLNQDKQKLELAYAMDAFAAHFLSDRFSAGHLRTPRVELADKVTPSLTGSLLSGYMHNEENELGLHVHNVQGDEWVCFGDKSLYNDKNLKNETLVITALQISADEVFAAYKTGSPICNDQANDIIPLPDEVNGHTRVDISPLFYWDNKKGKIMRRVDMTNPYDKHWTDDWWGWTTLIELKNQRGITPEAAALLSHSTYHDQAVKDGLITN